MIFESINDGNTENERKNMELGTLYGEKNITEQQI